MPKMFEDEKQIRELLMKWLKDNGFIARKGLYVKSFEIDIAALASAIIGRGKIKKVGDKLVYAFEAKIATTYMLARNVVEQAITRLLVADYVYIVVPKTAEIWKNGTTKEVIEPPQKIKRIASGVYSKNIGIIAVEPSRNIEVVRAAKKSGLTIKELRNLVVKELFKSKSIRPLY